MSLIDKVALVTGGGRGIGAACCNALAEQGAAVLVADIDVETAREVVREISASGGKALALELDVTSENAWSSSLEIVRSEFGQLDILVNNAGIISLRSVEDESLENWQKVMSVNVEGTFLGIRECMKIMRESNGGSVVNLSSIAGIVGNAQNAAYAASKGAVRLLTKSAALHGASLANKIRVNSVHPGFVATPMLANLENSGIDLEEAIRQQIPLGHMAEPEDIADAVVFLASDKARYITGSELVVDGGLTAC